MKKQNSVQAKCDINKIFLCQCKCKFDGKKCNSNQKWSNDKCVNGSMLVQKCNKMCMQKILSFKS